MGPLSDFLSTLEVLACQCEPLSQLLLFQQECVGAEELCSV